MDDMSTLIALSKWMTEPAEHRVAFHKKRALTAIEFKQRVKDWVDFLGDKDGSRWAVYHEDSYEFVAILFALWQLNRTACVPGDNLPATVERLDSCVDGYIGNFPNGLEVEQCTEKAGLTRHCWKDVNPNFSALEIYTSGSTGDPKPISKTIVQLELEIKTLERQWPSEQGCSVLSTVSHQHFYGMIFRLLWPLSVKQPFSRFSCDYIEDIYHAADDCSSYALISSPSHLARINTVKDWRKLQSRCHYVFSSAAPLLQEDSINVARALKTSVREIYGSSETGAIAWRIQNDSNSDVLWRALLNVTLSADESGVLKAASPYLMGNEPMRLADVVIFYPNNRFRLDGRIDSIVKVEGKRVSLMAIERLLLKNEWVKHAKALTLNRRRVETAVVIQLTVTGEQHLQLVGKKEIVSAIKSSLLGSFELVVIPRRWRFVKQMPYNTQGKLPKGAILKLFDKEPVKWPTVEEKQTGESSVMLKCYLPVELIYFDGHFENNPILPGVVQTYWAEKFGRELLSINGRFRRLEAIKFVAIIRPKSRCTISLQYNSANKVLAFKYESNDGLHSSGRICFE